MSKKMLYLIRGLPGSGKSTLAQGLAGLRVEADSFFMKETHSGRDYYSFDATQLHQAHKWCQSVAERWMQDREFPVIVSNTFTTEKEMKPYLDMAKEYGYDVTSIIVENRHGNKSVHDVPAETIDKMRNRFSVKL